MKRAGLYSLLLLFVICQLSCIKNKDIVYTGMQAEVDAASWNANSAGVTYPILTRVVPENRPISTSLDSTLRRYSGIVRVRVNMVGAPSNEDQTVGYKTFGSPITTI